MKIWSICRKKIIIINTLLAVTITTITAQVTQEGIPFTDTNTITPPDDTITLSLPVESRSNPMTETQENPMTPKIGTSLSVNKTITECGNWTQLSDGSLVWQAIFTAPGAKAIGVVFSNYHLDENTKLYIYNENKETIIGALTNHNNNSTGILTVAPIPGQTITIELNIATPKSFDIQLTIQELIYIYATPTQAKATNTGAEDACFVSVNCSPEGDDWQKEKRGIARMAFCEGKDWYVCSGSLVNNTRQDGTPYFLTAYHCGGKTSDQDKAKSYFIFDFEENGCGNGDINLGTKRLSGAKRIAYSPYDGGTDMLLLLINETPPSHWNLYWNGWNYSTKLSSSGVCIHHPAITSNSTRHFKRISTYTTPVSRVQYACAEFTDGIFCGLEYGYLGVVWSRTQNGYSVLAPGSSGSPLFNADHQIIGTLTGGSSSCETPVVDGISDYFGRFDLHWNYSSTPERQLKQWLDPLGISVNSFGGLEYVGIETTTTQQNTQKLTYHIENRQPIINWQGQPVQARAYNTAGQLIGEKTLVEGPNTWQLPENNIYLIQAGKETLKIQY